MPRAARSLALLFVAALSLAGCVGKGRNAPAQQESATLVVQNRAFIDVDVFALYGGTRARLGMVTANGTATFRISPAIVGAGRELRFAVDPIGSRRQGTSFTMYVTPGEQVSLTVPPSFAN
ncbi:MAG TPA: hypothetical protein VM890_13330 [Longimicrobium sp.]|jgi:hypothetical protein|nr:hypothetical protein [Longimicrobium sp.]